MSDSSSDAVSATELREIALEVALAAAAHIRRRRPELFGHEARDRAAAVATKSSRTDPVTVADTEAEALIRDRLAALRPDDAILGEEEGGSIEVPGGVRWVVDPIDGTVNFLYGVPAYAVSIAAQIDGVSVAGAVVDVARDVAYHAARGDGACCRSGAAAPGGEIPLSCNDIADLDVALVATGFGYDAELRRAQGAVVADLLPRVRDIRRIGSAALDLCMVASGQADVHYEHGLSPWDWAAGSLIASEAGARVMTPAADSRSVDRALTLVAAPGVFDQFADALAGVNALGAL
nr:inositol monophosphatase family protein [Jongsikchunia kroppenstedtii]